MKITFIGTGTGMPDPKRYPSSIAIEADNKILLVDTGPGILWRLQKAGIDFKDIDCILYTHFHSDHTSDLPAFMHAFKGAKREKKLHIYGPKGTQKYFKDVLKRSSYFVKRPFETEIHELEDSKINMEAIKISTKPMLHGRKTDNSIGYRIEYEGRVFAYSGDTAPNNNIQILGKDADILVIECGATDPNDRGAGHMTAEDCGKCANEAAAKKLVMTHFYLRPEEFNYKERAKKFYKGKIVIGKDLMRLKV